MASIRKRDTGWFVEVRKGGVTKRATFPTKTSAQAWATRIEAEILDGQMGVVRRCTFGDLLDEYANKVSPKKKSGAGEQKRIAFYRKMPVCNVMLADLTPKHFTDLRDQRLAEVSSATVRRDFILLSAAINVAIKEWGWLKTNPMASISKPADSPARDRLIKREEIEAICIAAGYQRDATPKTMVARIAAAFLFAIETGMRLSEIIRLTRQHTHLERKFAHLPDTKNGTKRDVPLSAEAIRIIKQMPEIDDTVFGITTSASADSLFRRIKTRAGIADIHFHDTRHEAITRLSRKLDILALARMVGHKNIKQLQTYYNESAEDIAGRL